MKKYLVVSFLVVIALFASQLIAQEAGDSPAKQTMKEKKSEPMMEPSMNVEGFACGTAIEDRELQGEAETFPAETEKVYCWTTITGCEEPTTVEHVWYYGGEEKARVPLEIKYPRMRTWSSKTIIPEWQGDWKVEMVDETGHVLATVAFTVE